MARFSFTDTLAGRSELAHAEAPPLQALLSVNEARLRHGLARSRLGGALADALWQRLEAGSLHLDELGPATCLVHGDLGGRNLLVGPAGDGAWSITGLIDWEAAFTGWALWDVGSLFRYPRRYSESFRERFERAYREAGGFLPGDWWRTARLLDATRLVGTLNEERDLPGVFADCRELVEGLLSV